MKVLKKIVLEDGYEFLDPTELIDEINDPDFKMFSLGKPICDVLNYYQENSPDAFGNAPYDFCFHILWGERNLRLAAK